MKMVVLLVLAVMLAACAQTLTVPSGVPVIDPGLYHDPGNDAFCASHPNEGTCQ